MVHGRLLRPDRQARAHFRRRRHRRRARAAAGRARDHRGRLFYWRAVGSRGGRDRAQGRGAGDGRVFGRLDPDHRSRQRQDPYRRGAGICGRGAGNQAGEAAERRFTRSCAGLRRHRQDRRRADPLQDQHQRAAARLAGPSNARNFLPAVLAHRRDLMLSGGMTDAPSALAIARDLLRCPSVTPADAGALGVLENILKAAGFEVHRVTFGEPGTTDIDNLYARIGGSAPHITFAGHTDVVPPGDESAWSHGAFAGDVKDGLLYGRGAVDMKGGIACGVAAVLDYLRDHGGKPKGSISFLITGDEEDISVNGTIKLLQWVAARGEKFDHCVLREPSNVEVLGDCIKVGRRGSLHGMLYVDGIQGHVAYPHRAANPVPDIARLIVALSDEPLDHGSALFQASNLEFTSVDVGNTAGNVIPGQARAKFNIRFNDLHTQQTLRELVEQRLTKAAGNRIRARIVWEPSNSNVFVTKPGPFTDLAVAAIEEVTGRRPELSTSGGTSDARFIASYCPVIEFGLVGQTMHQIDERAAVSDLEKLTRVYRGILDRYFA